MSSIGGIGRSGSDKVLVTDTNGEVNIPDDPDIGVSDNLNADETPEQMQNDFARLDALR